MKTLFTFVMICVIVLSWGYLFPREENTIPVVERTIINPYAADDTLVIQERPDWVLPQRIETISHSVTVTVYNAVREQCDSSPDILADGTRIDVSKAGQYRYCALSRNMLDRWGGSFAYGDTIYLDGAGHLSGMWIVKDTMNKRFTNRMDLLVDVGSTPYKFASATVRKVI